jgi:hypothetical protein
VATVEVVGDREHRACDLVGYLAFQVIVITRESPIASPGHQARATHALNRHMPCVCPQTLPLLGHCSPALPRALLAPRFAQAPSPSRPLSPEHDSAFSRLSSSSSRSRSSRRLCFLPCLIHPSQAAAANRIRIVTEPHSRVPPAPLPAACTRSYPYRDPGYASKIEDLFPFGSANRNPFPVPVP